MIESDTLTSAGTTTMRWGLVGSRGYAASACAPAFDQADGAELAAVLGSDRARAEALANEHGEATGYDDLGAFLTVPDVDAVWIASPTFLHYTQALAAIEAGKHVLVEKPLAMTSKEAWTLVAAAKANCRLLATGYQARYVPGHHAMRRLIAEGQIGDVVAARTYYGVHRSGPPSPWRQQRVSARWGALGDIGTHHVDLLRMLLGDITDACGLTGTMLGFDTDDTATAALRFASGAVASLTVSVAANESTTLVEVIGRDGSLVARDTSPRGAGSVMLHRTDREPLDVTGAQPIAWIAQLEAVTRAACGSEEPYATGEDGARNIEVLERLAP